MTRGAPPGSGMLTSVVPLFVGLALLMVGNGLLGTLIGVRSDIEGFSTVVIGVVMSSYYVGFLLGSLAIPRWLVTVGHIRVFAALENVKWVRQVELAGGRDAQISYVRLVHALQDVVDPPGELSLAVQAFGVGHLKWRARRGYRGRHHNR